MKRPSFEKYHKGPYGTSQKPVGVVIHCTQSTPREGKSDRHGVINYLASQGLSVPIVVDDGGITEMVPRPYNGYHAKCLTEAYGIEQIGFAQWSTAEWLNHKGTIRNAAQQAAWFLHDEMGLAVTRDNLRRFVVGHDRDHKLGGCSDHWDPGPDYPWPFFRDEAIRYARKVGYRVVATKGDREKVRQYRRRLPKRAIGWLRKKAKRGWRVVTRKKRFRADFDGWD